MTKRVRGYWMNRSGQIHLIPSLQMTVETSFTDSLLFNEYVVLAIEILFLNRWCAVEFVFYKPEEELTKRFFKWIFYMMCIGAGAVITFFLPENSRYLIGFLFSSVTSWSWKVLTEKGGHHG